MIKSIGLLFLLFLSSCTHYGQLNFITDLPDKLEENSGLISLRDSTIWTVEDNGNKDEIYKIDFKGNILKSLKVKNAKNRDWEDLTKDKKGYVYIADIGNNANDRKDLTVYKIPDPEIENGSKIEAEKIEFHYPQQKKFPPKKSKRYYDAEAIFHHGTQLYIFTKNRSNPFTGETHIYTVPDLKGRYEAKLIGTVQIGQDWKTCQITGIDISPDGTTIVALSYGKLFVFTGFTWDNFSKGNMREIDLGIRTQLESICFINNNTLLLSDEASHGQGGDLYSYTLQD
ncbi:hypothetical protein [Maribacter sp. 2304DJ31-5]|uniref:hypothetical protein n=1 Tax=Maribacter sp. 2304DJ31-5 TaxID=3386273 RepID=UPI0039BCB4DD